jgi:hypothetical protein
MVGRRLPTAAARFRAQVMSYRVCGGQSDTAEVFLRVLRCPLPLLILLTAPHSSSSIIRGWYNRPISGPRTKWTQSYPTPKTKGQIKQTRTYKQRQKLADMYHLDNNELIAATLTAMTR